MIKDLILSDESKSLEFKETLHSLDGIIKTIISFANTAGGIIVIGVENRTKKIVGVVDPLVHEERLASAIHDSIAPLLMPDIEIHSYRKKELLVIRVPHGVGPYHVKSVGIEKGTYVRIGSTNRLADSDTIHQLKNLARNIRYDETPEITQKIDDVDWRSMEQTFAYYDKKITRQRAANLGILAAHNNKDFPSRGGIILFGKNRLSLFPDAYIRCARFLGTHKSEIMNQVDLDIYLPLALEEALNFVRRNTTMKSEIKTLVRKDIPEYPVAAVREVLTNAIVHADYSLGGIVISVAIFDDRMEITNPGNLPFGITIEKALEGASRVRNRVIARVFQALGLVEQWGSGLQRVVHECALRGLPEPQFQEMNNQFRVTLYAEQKRTPELSDEQVDFVKTLKKKKKMSTKQAAEFWGITPRAARTRLIKLINAGFIKKQTTSPQDPQGVYIVRDSKKR